MPVPKSLKISGIQYKIKETPDLRRKHVWKNADAESGESSLLGACNAAMQTIHMSKDQSLDVYKMTLLHEVLHAMLSHTTYAQSDEQENICMALEPLLYNFIRDNRKFIEYMWEKK